MYDVIIIGAGPAGLMCANNLETSNYLVLEKKEKPLKKLLISGNGRCNLTNKKSNDDFINVIDYNKKYLYSTINLFGPNEIFNYFSKYIKLKIEDDEKVFPLSDNASDISEVLLRENYKKILCNTEVIEIIKDDDYFTLITNEKKFKAKILVIATGGASFPATGSSGDHIKFAKNLGQNTIELYPAETSVILNNNLIEVNGISFEKVNVFFNKRNFSGNLMFTKNGLSGSAIMNASGYISREKIKDIYINFIPDLDIEQIFENSLDKELIGAFGGVLTKKFLYALFSNYGFFHKKLRNISEVDKVFILNELMKKKFEIKCVSNIKTAYVTGGGIDLNFINTKTFESKTCKNLYFAGESLDIHGPIGGYNITLALSTGYSVSENINKILKY